jgi:hypothetical protein
MSRDAVPIPHLRAAHPRRARTITPAGALALCGALCIAVPAHTDSGMAAIGVSVRVLSQARLIQLDALPTLDITDDDVARGFAATSVPAQLRVQSNSREGFALELLPLGDWFSAVDVTGLQGAVTLGSEGGTVVQRWSSAGSADLALGFRFRLTAGTVPGHYALPLQLRVRPLEP